MDFIATPAARPLRGLDYVWRDIGPREAPVLVLLHGLMDTAASFAPLVETLNQRLSPAYRIIAPDWRGHGATAWAPQGDYWFPQYLADLAALLDVCVGKRPVTLIGHSMGGQIASLFAGTRAERVERLILLDSLNVPDSDPDKAPGRYRRWLSAQAEPPSPKRYASQADIADRIGHRYPELSPAQHDFLARHWSTSIDGTHDYRMCVDPWHLVSFPYGFRAHEAMAIWRDVQAPTLCVDGGQSPAYRFIASQAMDARRACFASLQRVVIEHCGHMLHLQDPEAVGQAICHFLQTTSPAERAGCRTGN